MACFSADGMLQRKIGSAATVFVGHRILWDFCAESA
jgi:hypothetical protein